MLKRRPVPAQYRMTLADKWQTIVPREVAAAKLRKARKEKQEIKRTKHVGCISYEIGALTLYPIWS